MKIGLEILAECLGLSKRRVLDLAQEGVIPKSVEREYDLVPSVRGYIESLRSRTDPASISLTQEKALLAKRQRERIELELAQTRGGLISVKLVKEEWEKLISASRARLLVIPTKLAPLIFTLKSIPEIKEVIENVIHEALRELARTEVIEGDMEPASKPKRKRVGRRKETAQL